LKLNDSVICKADQISSDQQFQLMHFLSFKKLSFIRTVLLLVILMFAQKATALHAVLMKNIFYAPAADHSFAPYLETYWQIDPQSVLFSRENGFFQARIRTDIVVKNDTGIAAEEHYILSTTPIADGNLLYTQNILDLRRYALAPGKYHISISFTDELKATNKMVITDSFSILPLTAPTLSDIQLIDTIVRSENENIFQRNGHTQIPLCTNFLDEVRKTLHFYAEFYQPAGDSNNLFFYTAYISKKASDPFLNRLVLKDTLFKKPVQFIEQKFSLRTLPSGNYHISIVVFNEKQERINSKTLFFQLLNAHPEQPAQEVAGDTNSAKGPVEVTTYLNLNKSFLGKYSPAQIRAILKMLVPVADPNERTSINGFLKNPDDTYARYFIYNFWTKRNNLKPEESWKEYADRVKQVNKLFGSSILPGYESERGVVYLKYGPPTERMVVNNESNAYPYEIWQYNTLRNASNAMFLFYRPGLVTNDYRLLHTTVNGEIMNRNWRANLYIDGGSTDANSSRAEQYIGNR